MQTSMKAFEKARSQLVPDAPDFGVAEAELAR
jgi:hypothetical protein